MHRVTLVDSEITARKKPDTRNVLKVRVLIVINGKFKNILFRDYYKSNIRAFSLFLGAFTHFKL